MNSRILRKLRTLNFIPVTLVIRPFFWGFLSISLFFSALSLLVMKDFFPVYFPFLLVLLMGLVFFLRAVGLYIALVCLMPFFYWTFKEKAIWELTLLYSLAIGYFITLLALEEDYSVLAMSKTENPVAEVPEKNAVWEEQKRDFEKTLEQLKEEARRRYLETSTLENDLQQTKQLAQEHVLRKEVLEKDLATTYLATDALKHDLARSCLTVENLKNEREEISQKMEKAFEDASYVQKELVLTREKLEEEKFKTHTLEEEQAHMQTSIVKLEQAIAEIQAQKESALAEFKAQKELALVDTLKQEVVDDESMIALKKDFAHVLGKYNQLKEQFEEKAKVLSQARRELFQTQGKLMVFEREQQLALDNFASQQDMHVLLAIYENEIGKAQNLKEEINNLEELISDLLT